MLMGCLFLAVCALLALAVDGVVLDNGVVSVEIDEMGALVQLNSSSPASTTTDSPLLAFENDSWLVNVSVGSQSPVVLSPATCTFVSSTSTTSMDARFDFECRFPFSFPDKQLPITMHVGVLFSLHNTQSRFVSKQLAISSSRPRSLSMGSFFLHEVDLFHNTTISCAGTDCPSTTSWFVRTNPYLTNGHIASFARFGDKRGAFVTVTNPFSSITAWSSSCTSGLNHKYDDLPNMPIQLPDAWSCEQQCASNPQCLGFVFLDANCEGNPQTQCFLKTNTSSPQQEPCSCLSSKPFPPRTNAHVFASYSPSMAHNSSFQSPTHLTDFAIVGPTDLGKYRFSEDGVMVSEREAFVACVRQFLLDNQAREHTTVKVNVAWDENDYQLDVAENSSIAEYDRIFARSNQLGITHIVFEPQNSLFSSRFNTTDGWGWEASLWFGLGENIRQGSFDPMTEEIPDEIASLVSKANSTGLKLLAYVYPCLEFEAVFDHVIDGALDLSHPRVQEYVFRILSTFMEKTGAGGFAWDHDIFAGPSVLHYAQWRAWMQILAGLRAQFPDMVMDHRQTNHMWGPWYQLAGSYAEPIAGDENPETYGVPLTSLHTDHVAANNMRMVNYVYSTQQLQPAERVPGFMFHQTERTADNGSFPCFGNMKECFDSNIRDFDLLGYRYSVLSSIGTAGLNNVLTMIPARDEQEFSLLPARHVNFIHDWLQWTDEHIDCLHTLAPIATLPAPSTTSVDGTSCVSANGDEAFVFLFNPGMVRRNVTIACDESILQSAFDATNVNTELWSVVEEYPEPNSAVGTWTTGSSHTLQLFGADAMVLRLAKITKQRSSRVVDRMAPLLPLTNTLPPPNSSIKGAQGLTRVLEFDSSTFGSRSEINGVRCSSQASTGNSKTEKSQRISVTFAGPAVFRSMPISEDSPAPDFQGGWFNTTFTVLPEIVAQLKARAEEYPIDWQENEYDVAWLVPHRLLMNPFLTAPADSLKVSLYIDNKPVNLQPAYNSRALKRSSCFLGFFWDASQLEAGGSHTASILFSDTLTPGQFQGLFWENIETIFTSEVESCVVEN